MRQGARNVILTRDTLIFSALFLLNDNRAHTLFNTLISRVWRDAGTASLFFRTVIPLVQLLGFVARAFSTVCQQTQRMLGLKSAVQMHSASWPSSSSASSSRTVDVSKVFAKVTTKTCWIA